MEKAEGNEYAEAETALVKEVEALVEKYEEAMEDDFNTADAIAAIFEIVKLRCGKYKGICTVLI